ncbi:MAG: hypothetical protein Q8P60_04025, partial [Pseudorhodobacter sp.]|nr:hypothetical protein [Pseudorhodobacter sp.]
MSVPSALSSFGLSVAFGLGLALAPVAAGPVRAEASAGQVASAIDAARVTALTDTMMMDDVLAVMREEGLEYGRTLSSEMFPDKGGAQWDAVVARIYDPATMRSRFDAALLQALTGAE